ncbi:MAG: hypothetical protein ACOVLB_03325 [Candidatus Nanopelagicus sp.]
MKDNDYHFVNENNLTQEELARLIKEKFQRMQEQIELMKQVDDRFKSVLH